MGALPGNDHRQRFAFNTATTDVGGYEMYSCDEKPRCRFQRADTTLTPTTEPLTFDRQNALGKVDIVVAHSFGDLKSGHSGIPQCSRMFLDGLGGKVRGAEPPRTTPNRAVGGSAAS